MSLPELAAAIFLLLVTPGPTNSLVALAGAERGMGRALRVIPAKGSRFAMARVSWTTSTMRSRSIGSSRKLYWIRGATRGSRDASCTEPMERGNTTADANTIAPPVGLCRGSKKCVAEI